MNTTRHSDRIWTGVVVAIVTLLIWAWAAGETLDNRQVPVRLNYTARDAGAWIVRASTDRTTVTIEGPTRALQEFAARADTPINIELGMETLPARTGQYNTSVESLLTNHPELRNIGVRIVESKPANILVDVDERTTLTAEIRPELSGVQTESGVTVQPPTAKVVLPGRLRNQINGPLTLIARADPAQLSSLEPDRPQSLVLNLTLPEGLSSSPDITITPAVATVTFTVRSQIRELELQNVRVQISGTPENADEYHIEVEPKQLSDITIRADGELIRRIQRDNIPVVAFVHLTSLELEQRITSKPVTYFMAILPNTGGGAAGVALSARAGVDEAAPLIQLKIVDRALSP